MDITFLGHSTFKIKGKTCSVVTDPYDPKMLGFSYPKLEAEIVTVSHSHPDHNFTERVTETKLVISEPGEYEVAGVSVIGIPSFHDATKGEQRGKNTIFVYELDGIRLAHLGDLGHKLSDDYLSQIGDIDILFIPCGGEFTIGPEDASAIVRDIEPTIVVPMHYKEVGLNSEIASKLLPVDDFIKESGLSLEKVDKLTVKAPIDESAKKVVVIERK